MNEPEITIRRKRLILSYDSRIGAAIAQLRREQGLGQADVASSFGCGQPMMSKIECGQRSLKVSELGMLAEALGIPRRTLVYELLTAVDPLRDAADAIVYEGATDEEAALLMPKLSPAGTTNTQTPRHANRTSEAENAPSASQQREEASVATHEEAASVAREQSADATAARCMPWQIST